jgi:hypothetical protein
MLPTCARSVKGEAYTSRRDVAPERLWPRRAAPRQLGISHQVALQKLEPL